MKFKVNSDACICCGACAAICEDVFEISDDEGYAVAKDIEVTDDEYVNLTYTLKNDVPFERIRRITGYLVGTLDKWNDAKRAEERDRVKHTVNQDFGNNA